MTHGCTDCGYSYMAKCEVYEDGTCKRDRAEAYTEVEASTEEKNPTPSSGGLPNKPIVGIDRLSRIETLGDSSVGSIVAYI